MFGNDNVDTPQRIEVDIDDLELFVQKRNGPAGQNHAFQVTRVELHCALTVPEKLSSAVAKLSQL